MMKVGVVGGREEGREWVALHMGPSRSQPPHPTPRYSTGSTQMINLQHFASDHSGFWMLIELRRWLILTKAQTNEIYSLHDLY